MNKKIKLILVVLGIFLLIPLVSAFSTIQEFLVDMKAHPNNYYVWHQRTESQMTSKIQNFANQFGVQVSSTKIPGRNFVLIAVADSPFGQEYEISSVSRVRVVSHGVDYLTVWTTVEEGNYNPQIGLLEQLAGNLDIMLTRLLSYHSSPINSFRFVVVQGEVVKPRNPTCSEWQAYDNDIYTRDSGFWQGKVIEDMCSFGELVELECRGGSIGYGYYKCPRGCLFGACMVSIFDFVGGPNFGTALQAWI